MAQHNVVYGSLDSLLALMAFMKTPRLTLCAASPALRLAAEHSVEGYRCASCRIKVKIHESQSRPMYKTRLLTVSPSVYDTPQCVEGYMGWWLERHPRVYISVQWEDYCYYPRNYTLPHPIALLHNLKLTRCYVNDSMAWVPGCRHLQALTLHNCTFIHSNTVMDWFGKCTSLRFIKIDNCECAVDLRILAKLPRLKRLHLVTSRRVRKFYYIGECASLETIHITTPFGFSFAGTIATLPRIRSIHIRCPYLLNVESIRRCQLLESITIHCPTLTITTATVALPRLKHLEVRSTAMENIDWLGPSLKTLVISDSSGITTISTIGQLHYITKLDIRGIDIDRIDWIRNCSLVEDLSMGPCKRISDLSAIGTLQYLTKLHILNSSVVSIQWIENCLLLEKVSLVYFEAIVDLSPIKSLPSLKWLDIRSDSITSIQCVEDCQSLESLVIAGSKIIDDFSPIGKLKSLRTLYLSYTNFTHTEWDQIQPCISLRELGVRGCLNIVDFSPIAGFEGLTILHMSETRVADIKWIEGCKMLEYLTISQCIHIEDFSPIGTLKKLKTVDMSYTQVKNVEWVRNCSALKWAIIIGCNNKIVGIKLIKRLRPQVIFVMTDKERNIIWENWHLM